MPTASSTRSSTSGAASASTSWTTAPWPTPSIPDNPAWLFDPETMKPLVNNPGWVQAIQDVIDLMSTAGRLPARPDQRGSQHDRLPAVPRRHRRAGHVVGRRGLATPARRTRPSWATWSASTSTRAPTGSTTGRPARGRRRPNRSPNNAYIGWGVYVTNRVSADELKRKCAWSAAAHLGGKDLSLWMAAYPSGFQPYRNSHFNYRRVGGRGLRPGLHRGLPLVERRQLQPSERGQRAAHPGHLPVLLAGRGRARQGPGQLAPPRRRSPTTSRPAGRRSPTRSAATARSSSTGPRSVCDDGRGRGDSTRPPSFIAHGDRRGARPPRTPSDLSGAASDTVPSQH